jgi:hypothetical protein
MTPLAWHVTSRLYDDRVIAPTIPERRRLARAALRIGRDAGLLAFAIADTHLHAELACDRVAAGRFAWRVELSAQAQFRPGVPFERARIRPIADQRHLANAFWYVLRQQQRHGLDVDPHFEGSSLPDLLGLRSLDPGLAGRVRTLLPRVRRAELIELLGRADDLEVCPADFAGLAAATAAAAALPDLTGRTGAVVAARTAAIHAVGPTLASPAIARLLGCSESAVRRLRGGPPPAPGLVRAIRRQLVLLAPSTTPPAPEQGNNAPPRLSARS